MLSMAHLTKSLSFYKLVHPSVICTFSNAVQIVAHRPYSCYCIKRPSPVAFPRWNKNGLQNKDFQIRNYAQIESIGLQEIEDRVMESIRNYDKIDKDKLTKTTNFTKDLGLDSLDHVELIMALEEEFGDEIPDVEAEKLMTPQDVIDYISRLYIVDEPTT